MAEPIDTTFYSGELTPEEQARFNDLFTDIAGLQFEVGLDGMNGDDGFYDIFANSDKVGSQFNVTVDTEDRKLRMEELQEPITDTYQNGDVVEFTDVVLDDDTQTVQEATVEFVGVKNTKSRSKSATTESTTFNIDPQGASSAENATMRLTGVDTVSTETRSGSLSDGGSESITVDGDAKPTNAELTISGSYSETSQTQSISGSSGSESLSVSVDGSLPPHDEAISIEPSGGPDEKFADGYANSQETTIDTSGVNEISTVDVEVMADSQSGGNYEIYLDGTKIYSGFISNGVSEWVNDISVNQAVGSEATLILDHYSEIVIGSYNVYKQITASNIQVSGDASANLGSGGSQSINLDRGANNIDITWDGDGTSVSGEISWTDRNGVKKPSVSVGSSTVAHTGVLDGSVTETVDLSTGTTSVDADYNGSGLSYNLEWKEHFYPTDPTMDFDSETTTLTHTGNLEPGQTKEKSINLTTGTHTVDISSTDPVQAEVVWDDVSITEDPEIVLNGNSVSDTGSIADGNSQTVTVDPSYLVSGTNSVTVNTVSATPNSDVQVKLTYGDNSAFLHSTYNSLGFTPSSATLSGLYEADQDVTVTFYIEDDAGNSVEIPSFDSETSLSALSSGNVRLVAEIDRTAFSQSFSFDNYSVFFTQ